MKGATSTCRGFDTQPGHCIQKSLKSFYTNIGRQKACNTQLEETWSLGLLLIVTVWEWWLFQYCTGFLKAYWFPSTSSCFHVLASFILVFELTFMSSLRWIVQIFKIIYGRGIVRSSELLLQRWFELFLRRQINVYLSSIVDITEFLHLGFYLSYIPPPSHFTFHVFLINVN